jgi:hypothetical protein
LAALERELDDGEGLWWSGFMRTFLTLIALLVSFSLVRAGDLERKALEYAHFTGRTYGASLYFLKLGTWCKENPQGGVFGSVVYDAKLCAETLARMTAVLQTPASEEELRRIKQERQLLAEHEARLTGRTPEECLKASDLEEWCVANEDGGVWEGKRRDAAEVAAMLKQSQDLLTQRAPPPHTLALQESPPLKEPPVVELQVQEASVVAASVADSVGVGGEDAAKLPFLHHFIRADGVAQDVEFESAPLAQDILEVQNVIDAEIPVKSTPVKAIPVKTSPAKPAQLGYPVILARTALMLGFALAAVGVWRVAGKARKSLLNWREMLNSAREQLSPSNEMNYRIFIPSLLLTLLLGALLHWSFAERYRFQAMGGGKMMKTDRWSGKAWMAYGSEWMPVVEKR